MQLSNSEEPKLREPKPNPDGTAAKAQFELKSHIAALTRDRNDRKSSAPASQQGGVRSESSVTRRSAALKEAPNRWERRI